MRDKTTRITLIVIIVIVGVVAYYSYLSNRSREQRKEAEPSAVESVLSRSMEYDYPPTPKEVMKYYNELMQCFYNEDCTDEEIEALGNRARELYDEELLANNDQEVYLMNLKADIEDYKENKRRISGTSVASSANVEYFSQDGYEFARIMCGYTVLEGKNSTSVKQVYLLREDEDNRWKIYGWESFEEYQKSLEEQ